MANGYSSESTQRELSNGYQHDRVSMVFKDFCIFLPWTKVASALEGLNCKRGSAICRDELVVIPRSFAFLYCQPFGCWWLIWFIQNNAKKVEK